MNPRARALLMFASSASLVTVGYLLMASRPAETSPLDVVDHASWESFPASDAPGWRL